MGSREVGTWLNNLGPLQLDVLAPFTKVDPYWGTAAGVAATNIAAIVGVWLVSRRILGPVGRRRGDGGDRAARAQRGQPDADRGPPAARPRAADVVRLWLAAAAWMGRRWALPWLALAASFVLQTHFTYAYQTVAVAAAATIVFVVHRRRRIRTRSAAGLAAAAVTALCWVQPLWDQLFRVGQRRRRVRTVGRLGALGRSIAGLRILAESVFVPPFFTPGSMGDLLRRGSRPVAAVAVLALGVGGRARRRAAIVMHRRHRGLAAMGDHRASSPSPARWWRWSRSHRPSSSGSSPRTTTGSGRSPCSMATTIAGGALLAPYRRLAGSAAGNVPRAVVLAIAAATALAAIPLLRPTNLLPETDHEWAVSRQLARPLLDDLGASLDELDLPARY